MLLLLAVLLQYRYKLSMRSLDEAKGLSDSTISSKLDEDCFVLTSRPEIKFEAKATASISGEDFFASSRLCCALKMRYSLRNIKYSWGVKNSLCLFFCFVLGRRRTSVTRVSENFTERFLFFVFDMMLLGGAFTSGNVVVVSEHEIDESHTGVRGVFDKLH